MTLSPVDQTIQYIAWFLALIEFTMALYALVLNLWHTANRHVSVFLMLSAIGTLALGLIKSAASVAQAAWPTYLLAATAPAVGPWTFLLALTLLKPDWLRERWRWIWWLMCSLGLLPILLTVLDVGLGTRMWYTGLDARTYAGGFVPLETFAAGSLSMPIRVLNIRTIPILAIPFILYVAWRDEAATPLTRRLAWTLLATHIAAIAVQIGLRGLLSGGLATLITSTLFVLAYAHAAFQPIPSKQHLQRGRLQSRLTLLIMAVTVPVLVGIGLFINHRAGLLTQQIIAQQQGPALLSALQQFRRVSWVALIIGMAKLLAMAWLAIRQAFQPIGTLTDAATAIAAGDLTRTVPVESDDEIGILAQVFNRMTEQLRGLIGNLEQRVADRTAELRMANEKLQREIAERERAEQALRVSEEKYRLVVENANDTIIVAQDGVFKFFNPRVTELTGYPSEEVILQPITKIIHPDDRELVATRHHKRLRGEEAPDAYSFRVIDRDGHIKWVEIKAVALTWEGRPATLSFLSDITDRKQTEEHIQASLREKEVLLQEIHHRVKNNLQVVSSLLNLQSGYVDDPQALEIFRDSQNRVRSMALVHEKLYQSQDLARINFAEYVRNLATYLFRTYSAQARRITLSTQVDDVSLGIDAAVPCGLVLNELISNALKHAFPDGQEGKIRVELAASGDGQVTLTVSDDGVGFPAGLDFHSTTSLGLQLVKTLVYQLAGTVDLRNGHGTEFRITFSEAGEMVTQESTHSAK
jgi:PAS domain S-box-containing protein